MGVRKLKPKHYMKEHFIEKIEALLNTPNVDTNDILNQLKLLVEQIKAQSATIEEGKNIIQLTDKYVSILKEQNQGENLIKTGFDVFDKLFGGLTYGELVVIGGRPAMGKTLLLCNLALNISTELPTLYITYDLSESTLTKRIISSKAQIEISKLMQPDLTFGEKQILSLEEQRLKNHSIYITDGNKQTLGDLRAYCQKHIEEKGVKLIIVDYLQMMNSTESNIRYLKVGSFTQELRKIAKDFNVCVIAASQLNRFVETRGGDKRPQLSDLKDSGAIEQDADKVIFVYRPEYYRISIDEDGHPTAGVCELIMSKNRNGKLATAKLKLNSVLTGFM